MDSFIAYALIGSALDEVVANPSLLKHASTDPAAPIYDYLEKHAGELKAEVDCYCTAWLAGFRQKLAEAGLEKTALFGLEQTNPKLNTALEVARFGGYFVPGVGTGIMGAEALGNFGDMLAGGKSWTQRLGAGAAGLMNTGLAGLSLIPGAGIVGAALKSPKLLRLLSKASPAAARQSQSLGQRSLSFAQAPMKAMLGAAERGTGFGGRAMRALGFNPAFKPWVGKENPYQSLSRVSRHFGQLTAPKPTAGLAAKRRLHGQQLSKEPPPGYFTYLSAGMPAGRRMLAALPAQMVAGSVAAGPARVSQPAPWGAGHPQYEQALLKAMNN